MCGQGCGGEVEINYFLGLLLYRVLGWTGADGRRRRGSHGKLEKARENFNCLSLSAATVAYWRATLIKRGDPGQPAGLILKRRRAKAPAAAAAAAAGESVNYKPFIITNFTRRPPEPLEWAGG